MTSKVAKSPANVGSLVPEETANVGSLIRRSLEQQGFAEDVVETMLKCRRDTSVALYDTYLNKWSIFCHENNVDPIRCSSVSYVLRFLQDLFNEGTRGASAICTARSALSSIVMLPDGIKVGDNVYVKQFVKGIKAIRPAEPRYLTTWDPDIVLNMFKLDEWNPPQDLSLMQLSVKTVMLILLATYQRGQIIIALNLDRMCKTENEFRFKVLKSDLKQGSSGNFVAQPIVFEKRLDFVEHCIYDHLNVYISKTAAWRGEVKQLFLTTRKPFRAVSRDSVSHWIKAAMREAKIDISMFAPGSTRGASSSGAFLSGVPIEEICRKAGWSQASTFVKWYKR